MTARRVPPIAVAIVVGLAGGVAPVAYALLATPVPAGPPAPVVTFGNATSTTDGTWVDVATASPLRSIQQFSASLRRDGVTIAELTTLEGTQWMFSFSDRDQDRRLSPGDSFLARVRDEGRFEIRLLWRGQPVGSAAWDVVRPSVRLAPVQVGDFWATLDVQGVNPPTSLSEFTAQYSITDGSGAGVIDPLRVWNTSGFAFADLDADGRLSPGDRFSILVTPLATYEFRLFWLRMDVVAEAWWSVPAPTVAFAVAPVGSDTFWLNVTVSDPPLGCSPFEAFLYWGASYRDEISGLCGGTSRYGRMTSADLNSDLCLSVGDRIVVRTDAPGAWMVYLEWRGVFIKDVTWNA